MIAIELRALPTELPRDLAAGEYAHALNGRARGAEGPRECTLWRCPGCGARWSMPGHVERFDDACAACALPGPFFMGGRR